MRVYKIITREKYLDLLSNSLNSFFKGMYGDQFGEFVCGYWCLKGYGRLDCIVITKTYCYGHLSEITSYVQYQVSYSFSF